MFFNKLQTRGYPKWFLSDTFSEVYFDSRWSYLSENKDKANDMSHSLFFVTVRNPRHV